MTESTKQALQHEIRTSLDLMKDREEDIETETAAFLTAEGDDKRKLAYNLRTAISSWARHEDKYRLLHKIYHHGWGEDTRHE